MFRNILQQFLKEFMSFKRASGWYMGGFGGRKGKSEEI